MRPPNSDSLDALPALAEKFSRAKDPAEIQRIESDIVELVGHAAGRESPPWPLDGAERIAKCLVELKTDDLGSWPARVCRDQLGALRLWGRGIDLWALHPDGRVLWLDLDSVAHHSDVETDPLTIFAVMVHGAQAHPELADLIPRPEKTFRICSACRGTGSGPNELSCLSCSGLGWTG